MNNCGLTGTQTQDFSQTLYHWATKPLDHLITNFHFVPDLITCFTPSTTSSLQEFFMTNVTEICEKYNWLEWDSNIGPLAKLCEHYHWATKPNHITNIFSPFKWQFFQRKKVEVIVNTVILVQFVTVSGKVVFQNPIPTGVNTLPVLFLSFSVWK